MRFVSFLLRSTVLHSLLLGAALALFCGCRPDEVEGEGPGDLALASSPSGASVRIEKVHRGVELPYAEVPATPDTLWGLDDGLYFLHFSYAGYAPLDTTVSVGGYALRLVTASMQPMALARTDAATSR